MNIVLNGQKSLFLIIIWVCTKILAVLQKRIFTGVPDQRFA